MKKMLSLIALLLATVATFAAEPKVFTDEAHVVSAGKTTDYTDKEVVLTETASGVYTVMRCTGEYQIEKSKEGAETLCVTAAGRLDALPGDRADVKETKLGVSGRFRVIELRRRFDGNGETSEARMQRE